MSVIYYTFREITFTKFMKPSSVDESFITKTTNNMKMKFLLLIFSFLAVSNVTFAQGYKKLFNGKDLTGWTVHGTEKWYVENGELVCESGPDKEYGYLTTDKQYKNFIYEVDFKLESNGNSGIFIRSNVKGTNSTGLAGRSSTSKSSYWWYL